MDDPILQHIPIKWVDKNPPPSFFPFLELTVSPLPRLSQKPIGSFRILPYLSLSWLPWPPTSRKTQPNHPSIYPLHTDIHSHSHPYPSLSLQNYIISWTSILKSQASMAGSQGPVPNFQDYLPLMADKLGGDGLIGELCNGFNLLMDRERGVITFESLKRNAAFLGLQDFSDEDLWSMLKEGDHDGDGALNQMEFCVLMFRLSPELMEESRLWLEEALQHELDGQ